MSYVGWLLDDQDRAQLLELFPPRYTDVLAHHVTLTLNAKTPLPTTTQGIVTGYVDDGQGLECLLVAIDGTTVRPDGKFYHITWSIDRAQGRKPHQSNEVLSTYSVTRFAGIAVNLYPRLFS